MLTFHIFGDKYFSNHSLIKNVFIAHNQTFYLFSIFYKNDISDISITYSYKLEVWFARNSNRIFGQAIVIFDKFTCSHLTPLLTFNETKMSKIFDEGSDSEIEIKIDNEYAKNYDKWRKKEELNKRIFLFNFCAMFKLWFSVKTKYGEELLEEESSSSSEDDEEGVELTKEMEKQFFKTLACLKTKDPRIYDENVKFFDDPSNEQRIKKKAKKEKPLYISDYERELILKNNGQISDSDEVDEDPRAK